ncbi:protransforming growth factor alpha isoform X2 [Dunckerocampus dactyliophorus]|uniref:protransforming growth factor alpha isoform X2 n=1 Tax=Dunckerocampus dactyliophorus TaxID=161453 RepID=UPI002404F0F7|nr:protransforming growth factor alpha isoform X2 [Dunckerocampus dactyliophorus]
MTRILWDAIFLISGSLFTIGAGQSNSTSLEGNIAISADAAAALNASASGRAAVSTITSSNFLLGTKRSSGSDATIAIPSKPTLAAPALASGSSTPGGATTITTTTSNTPPVKKFVAAAVRSHFDDCPDSHRHFCFHGTCRFLILEETPACICHPGFVGMRCEHADLLAVVATNHHQQTVATVLVLCVIGCVLIIVLCTLLNCWWRQECRKRRRPHRFIPQEKSVYILKHGAPCYPSESVV